MISNIMIIDDNKIDLFISQKIIQKYNPEIQIKSYTNAISALDYLKISTLKTSIKTIVPPDLILLDINMPQMDGFEFMEEFKQIDLAIDKDIKVFMLSSSLYPEDIHKAEHDTCCSGYINKPITVNKLRDIIEEHYCEKNQRK